MRIDYLADHEAVIPTLARWFHREWGYLYPERSLEDVERSIGERTNTSAIPLALVAFEGEELIGTVCLKVHDMDTRMELSPWLAGLYVAEPWRKQGIGAALVAAIEEQAQALGVPTFYLYTPESESFYARLGWRLRERCDYCGCPVSIMEKGVAFL